jgi:hypothetical protein
LKRRENSPNSLTASLAAIRAGHSTSIGKGKLSGAITLLHCTEIEYSIPVDNHDKALSKHHNLSRQLGR